MDTQAKKHVFAFEEGDGKNKQLSAARAPICAR